MEELIKKIKQFLKTNNLKTKEEKPSILEIINRGYDEDLISKFLVFIFRNNSDLLNAFIRFAYSDFVGIGDDYKINCEENAYNDGRMDIFIKGKDLNGKNIYCVIENKINTNEHNDQCRHYYEFCVDKYKGYKGYFIFLHPNYNHGDFQLSSKEFKKVTYTDLKEIILNISSKDINEYETDFLRLIENKLEEQKMDDFDKLLIDNYEVIDNRMRKIRKDIDNVFDEISSNYSKHSGLLPEIADNHRTLRFYKGKDVINQWWSGYIGSRDEYYFYIEIKTENPDKLGFVIQRTIKRYSLENDTKLNKFIRSKLPSFYKKRGRCIVIDAISFKSDKQYLSKEWKDELIDWAVKNLDELNVKQEKLVEEFHSFEN